MSGGDGLTLDAVHAIVMRVAEQLPAGAGPDTPLRDGGFALDSINMLRTIIECEETFHVGRCFTDPLQDGCGPGAERPGHLDLPHARAALFVFAK